MNCDYECAVFLGSFYPACNHIISIMLGADKLAGYAELKATCASLPKRALIDAVAGITQCAKSSCIDGRRNGDEVGVDCSDLGWYSWVNGVVFPARFSLAAYDPSTGWHRRRR